MSRTSTKPRGQGLFRTPVLIEDTASYSKYFEVSQLDNRIFHAGKNGFLIRGTQFLKPNSEISIEIVDRLNNPVFASAVAGYEEGGSRLISVEIYEGTADGPANLIILGTAQTYADGRPIPSDTRGWRNRPNVRWVVPIQIETSNPNISPLRLANNPTAVITEKDYLTTRIDKTTVTSSLYTASLDYDYAVNRSDGYAIYMLNNAGQPATFFDTVNVDGIFTGSLFRKTIESASAGTITTVSTGDSQGYVTASVSMSLDKVLNETTAITQTPIKFGDDTDYINPLLMSGSFQRVIQIADLDAGATKHTIEEYTSSVVFEYVSESLVNTTSTSSVLNFRIPFVQTITGEIAKVKISSKESNAAITSFVPFTEFVPGERNLITSSSLSGTQIGSFHQAGVFTESHILDSNWFSALFNKADGDFNQTEYESAGTSLTYGKTSITSSEKILEGAEVDHTASVVPYFFGTKTGIQLYKNVEYTLKYTAVYTPTYVTRSAGIAQSGPGVNAVGHEYTTSDIGSLKTFITRTANHIDSGSFLVNDAEPVQIGSVSKHGMWVDNITTRGRDKSLYEREVNFKIPGDGVAYLRFKAETGFWNFGNIEITPAVERGFNPDEIIFDAENNTLPATTNDFKIQFLNFEDIPIDYHLIGSSVFVSASNLPSDGVDGAAGTSAASLQVSSNSQVFALDDSSDTSLSPTTVTITAKQQNQASNLVDGDLSVNNSAAKSSFNYSAGSGTGTGTATWTVTPDGPDSGDFPIVATVTNDGLSDITTLHRIVGGADGSAAKTVVVTATSPVFVKSRAGTITPSSVTITGNTQNTTTNGVWSNSGGAMTVVSSAHANPSVTVSNSQFVDGMTVTYTLAGADGSVADTVTLKLLDAEEGGVQAILSNSAHVLQANSIGAVSSYAGSGTTIRVYEGATELTFVTGTPAAGQWAVAVGNTANITEGGVTDSGTYCTIGNHSSAANGTDEYVITYTISGKTANGTSFTTFTQTQSLSKSKAGGSAITAILSNETHTFEGTPAGVVSDFSNSGTTISVFEGNTILPYDGTGTANSTFKTTATQTNIVSGSATDDGNTVTHGNVISVTDDSTTSKISFLIQGTDSEGTSFSITKLQTFSIAKAGSTAKTAVVTANSLVFVKAKDGTLSPSTITISANTQNTTTNGAWSTSAGTLTSIVHTHTNASAVVTSSNFVDGMVVTYTLAGADGSVADAVTLKQLDEGSGTVQAILSNSAHVMPASSTGAVSSYVGSGTTIRVYEGATELTFQKDASFTDATCDYNNDPTITHNANAKIVAGLSVSGTGIPAGATIASITDSTHFELSASTTGGAVTNGTLTFAGVPKIALGIGTNSGAASADYLVPTVGANDKGFYADGAGNFRVGNATNYIAFTAATGVINLNGTLTGLSGASISVASAAYASMTITGGTASTTKTSGALIVTGGVGASGDVHADDIKAHSDLTVSGTSTLTGNVMMACTAALGRLTVKQAATNYYGIVIEESASDAWIRIGHNGTRGSIHTSYNSSHTTATPLTLGSTNYIDTQLVLQIDGDVLFSDDVLADDFIASSDIRLKNVTGGVTNALSTVNKLNAIRYTWKTPNKDKDIKEHIGFSAQDVLELVPEAVYGSEETEYGISYSKLVPVLVEAIKELTAEVEALKKKMGE